MVNNTDGAATPFIIKLILWLLKLFIKQLVFVAFPNDFHGYLVATNIQNLQQCKVLHQRSFYDVTMRRLALGR